MRARIAKLFAHTSSVWYASDKMGSAKHNQRRENDKIDLNALVKAANPIQPRFDKTRISFPNDLRRTFDEAIRSWLGKTPSHRTRIAYWRDLCQFLKFMKFDPARPEQLTEVRPVHVAAWRDAMKQRGLSNATVRRKMTALRALYSYLQVYGYIGPNPAHSKLVKPPAVPRDGKTVGLSPADCRQLLDAPDSSTPVGIRERAMLAVMAYSACRVGELVLLTVGDVKKTGDHIVVSIYGKGGKERIVPLHIEAIERLNMWLRVVDISDDRDGPLFRPATTARGKGRDGFAVRHLTTRAVENIVRKYATQVGLDPAVTVHSFRVTALTIARDRGADIIDLQSFAGHSDPRTTLTYIRSQDRLSKSPAYNLCY